MFKYLSEVNFPIDLGKQSRFLFFKFNSVKEDTFSLFNSIHSSSFLSSSSGSCIFSISFEILRSSCFAIFLKTFKKSMHFFH